MKTSELTGVALNWAVANCEGVLVEYLDDEITKCLLQKPSGRYAPSTNWAQGGPIIEREGIAIDYDGEAWTASSNNRPICYHATTPLIAAMRCYVASKLGDDQE